MLLFNLNFIAFKCSDLGLTSGHHLIWNKLEFEHVGNKKLKNLFESFEVNGKTWNFK